jgi:energy-coupling factor transporter ATP-binding protein EcfA2
MDFALHTIGWQAFQDLVASIAEVDFARPVVRVAKTSDHGRDGSFVGVPDEMLAKNETRESTIQCKHFSSPSGKLTLASLKTEMESVRKLAVSGRASGYVLVTNASITEGDRIKIADALRECGVSRPYVFGREWVVAKILEHPRVRALVPRIYGLGDLGWIADARARDQAQAILDTMGDDLKCYVPTRAHRDAVKALDEHRFVMLLGDPAVGKSTIAAALCVAATDEDGCEVFYVRSPEEFVSTWDPNIENRLFWIDDAFGSIQYAPSLMEKWNKVFLTMKAAVRRNNRFVLTSRTYIWKQAKADLKLHVFPPLERGHVVVDVEKLTIPEKQRILYNHLKFGEQNKKFLLSCRPFLNAVVKSDDFRPEIARRLSNPMFTEGLDVTQEGVAKFFATPEAFLRETLANLAMPFRAAIGLIFVNSGRLPLPTPRDDATAMVCDLFGVDVAAIATALTSMKGSFVVRADEGDQSLWTYKHPTVADAFAAHIGENDELIGLYVRGAKVTQIMREAVCGAVSVKGAKVSVPASLYDTLLDRFQKARGVSADDLNRFLLRRCGDAFLKKFVIRFPKIVEKRGGVSYSATSDNRVLLMLRMSKLGCLSDDARGMLIEQLENQIRYDADGDFLLDRPEFEEFLTDDERDRMLSIAHDILNNLSDLVDGHANDYSMNTDWDPENWFDDLLGSVRSLGELFPDDSSIEQAITSAENRVERKIAELQEGREEEPDPDDYRHDAGRAAISGIGRSIFDDLV